MPAKVTGADRLNASLAAAGRRIEDMPARVHRDAGAVAADEIRARTPRRSGRLASSYRVSAAGDGATISAAGYGGYPNYGTRYQRAQRFIDDGLDAATEPVADVYMAEVDRALSQVKGA